MTLAMLTSSRWRVSEHSSTERRTATWSGKARARRRPRRPRRPCDAAQPEDGRALHVRAKAQAVHQSSVQRWSGDAGHGDEEEMVDVARLESRRVEGVADGLLTQLEGHTVEGLVALEEPPEREVLLERERQEAAAHLHGAVELLDALDVEMLARPVLPEERDQLLLVHPVRRQRRAHAAKPRSTRRRHAPRGLTDPRGGRQHGGCGSFRWRPWEPEGRAASRAPTSAGGRRAKTGWRSARWRARG
jgi:hypothetical protein